LKDGGTRKFGLPKNFSYIILNKKLKKLLKSVQLKEINDETNS